MICAVTLVESAAAIARLVVNDLERAGLLVDQETQRPVVHWSFWWAASSVAGVIGDHQDITLLIIRRG